MLKFNFQFEVPSKGVFSAEGEFQSGLRLALTGPSGCGKSTFLKALCGLGPRNSGSVSWDNKPLNRAILHEGLLGFCFQSSPLFPHLNVLGNLTLPLKTLSRFRNMSEDLRIEKALVLLKKASLENLAEKWPHELSGGEKKRISLLRAIIYDPALLVLDEPFSDIDADNRILFKSWIETQLQSLNGVLIFVSHLGEDLSLSNSHMRWPSSQESVLNFGQRGPA